jgi:uncharacterized NAD(P)/FAD-binding protein YdhS
MESIVIIGGGLSGALVAIQLLKAGRSLRIVVVEPRPQLGPGLAYSTSCAGHLMNVPSGKLSLADGDPKHFVKWFRAHYNARAADYSFAPRRAYGRYVAELLEAAWGQAGMGVSFEHVRSEAIALHQQGSRFCLRLRDGSTLEADAAVLALGNPPSSEEAIPAIEGSAFPSSSCYFRSPWEPGAVSALDPEGPVLLVGSGLTAVDTAIALRVQGHRGVIHTVSRRGLLPRSHALSPPPDRGGWKLEASTSLRELCAKVRKQIRLAEARGEDWRSVIDGLRADTPRLWRGLPCPERRCFLRHLRPYWDVHRHRMAPAVGAFIEAWLREGRLKLHAGRIRKILATADGAQVQIRLRGRSEELVLPVRRVINCTGPGCDYRKLRHPFWKDLFARGVVDSGPMGLGLKATAEGELITACGEVATNLFTLGPARVGSDWETIAIPEIRAQAAALASRLLATAGMARERSGVAAPNAHPHAEPPADLVGAARHEGRRQYL